MNSFLRMYSNDEKPRKVQKQHNSKELFPIVANFRYKNVMNK